jgi:hypothetical protein
MQIKGKVLQKASLADDSAEITIEAEGSEKFLFLTLDRDQARSGFDVGREVSISVEEVIDANELDADAKATKSAKPSEETDALMGGNRSAADTNADTKDDKTKVKSG